MLFLLMMFSTVSVYHQRLIIARVRHGRYHMVVGFTTICAISAYRH